MSNILIIFICGIIVGLILCNDDDNNNHKPPKGKGEHISIQDMLDYEYIEKELNK